MILTPAYCCNRTAYPALSRSRATVKPSSNPGESIEFGKNCIYYRPMPNTIRYWINTVSKDHLSIGLAGGFTQANHGKIARLKPLKRGDWIIFYSPKTSLTGDTLQAFTALGQISDDEPYQFQMTSSFHPWRRTLDFKACQETPIRPLLEELHFIKDKQH
jgi:EVE domain